MSRPSSVLPTSRLPGSLSLALIALLFTPLACSKDAVDVCQARLGITVEPGDFYVGDETTATAAWSPADDLCPSAFSWSVSRNLQIVGGATGSQITYRGLEGGFGTLSVEAGAGDYGTAQSVEVLRSTGDLHIVFAGLSDGAEPDIHLSGPNGYEMDIDREEMLRDVDPGTYSWTVNPVTGTEIGHQFASAEDTGSIDVQRNASATATIQYDRLTAQIDFDAEGVPETPPGAELYLAGDDAAADGSADVVLGGGGGHVVYAKLVSSLAEYVIRKPHTSIAVLPGTYAWELFTQRKGYGWQPTITTGTIAATLVATSILSVPFIATRGILDAQIAGLPSGVRAAALLTLGSTVFNPSLPFVLSRTPGAYILEVLTLQYTNVLLKRQETYQPVQAIHSLDIVAGQTLTVLITMFLIAWIASFLCNVSVVSDVWGHAAFIGFLLTILLLATIHRTQTGPPGPDGAASVVTETIEISGPAPWVTVTGPLQPDGSFVATGSGTVAGFPNVPVTFTGTLNGDSTVSGMLQMGSDTPPTGLPNGSITYSIEGMRMDAQ